MPSYGLLSTGLAIKTFEILRAENAQSYADTWGAQLPLGDETDLGKIDAIFCVKLAEAWELIEAAYNGSDADGATGQSFDAVLALTGLLRQFADYSTLVAILTGDDATTITIGSQASVLGTEERFATDAEELTEAVTAWAPTTAYVIGDLVKNDTPDRIYRCYGPGTSAGSGGPTGTGTFIIDNTAVWNYLGDGEAAAEGVTMTALNLGVVVASARTLTQIETPIGGWLGVINVADAVQGQLVETDENGRTRREEELQIGGSATIDAYRDKMSNVPDVTNVTVFWNHTDVTDSDGVPPHGVETLVQGGTDQVIADAILSFLGGGIQTYGTESAVSVDSEGNSHTINFSRYSEIAIWVDLDITYNATLYPADGDTLIEAEIVANGNALGGGVDVNAWNVTNSLQALAIGMLGITTLAFDTTGGPPVGTATIAIGTRELAVFAVARTNITSAPATP